METELDKARLGEFLSEEDKDAVLEAFVRLIDFSDMDFDLALRKFLFCFRMPGEAQKIGRVMRNFSIHYFSHMQDADIFADQVCVYAMAFGTIMLNTDAHNNQVRNKMTEKQFIDNIRYTQGGEKVPTEFLSELYERIREEEIMLEPERACFPNATRKGWMYLHSKNSAVSGSRWKRRWVVLSDDCLYICRKPAESVALYGIRLEGCKLEPFEVKEKARKNCFCIILPPSPAPNNEERRGNHVLFSTQTPAELEKWRASINLTCDPSSAPVKVAASTSQPISTELVESVALEDKAGPEGPTE